MAKEITKLRLGADGAAILPKNCQIIHLHSSGSYDEVTWVTVIGEKGRARELRKITGLVPGWTLPDDDMEYVGTIDNPSSGPIHFFLHPIEE